MQPISGSGHVGSKLLSRQLVWKLLSFTVRVVRTVRSYRFLCTDMVHPDVSVVTASDRPRLTLLSSKDLQFPSPTVPFSSWMVCLFGNWLAPKAVSRRRPPVSRHVLQGELAMTALGWLNLGIASLISRRQQALPPNMQGFPLHS